MDGMIPEPSVRDDPTEPGTFVVVALDPLASVSLLDDQAKLEVEAMTPTRYLALVDGHVTTEYASDGLLRLSPILVLVGSGLPGPPYSWAAIPISPSPPHPGTGRLAVEPLTPMRWSNCHIHTLSTVTGLISALYPHHTVGPVLTPEAYDQVTDAIIKDDGSITVDLDAGARFRPQFERPDIYELLRDDPHALDAEFGGKDFVIADLFPRDETPGMKLSFKMWIDTSSLSELGNPDMIEGEITRLKQIEWEWAQRTVAAMYDKQPETREWLRNIADAEAPVMDFESIPRVAIEADVDSLVHPEDAVEHRFERGTELPRLSSGHGTDSSAGWTSQNLNNTVPPLTPLPSRSPSLSSLTWPSTGDSVGRPASALADSNAAAPETSRSSSKSVATKGPFRIPVVHFSYLGTVLSHALSAGLSTFAFVKSFTWDLLFRSRLHSR